MNRLLERYFVKPRTVFAIEAVPYDKDTTICRGFHILGPSELEAKVPPSVQAFLERRATPKSLNQRLLSKNCCAFIAITESADLPIGVVWALAPQDTTTWHDSIPVRPGEALGFGAYVTPQFRRRGLFLAMLYERDRYLLNDLGVNRVLRVVENSNVPSYNGLVKYGARRIADNLLVKLMGRNILSIFRHDNRLEIYALVGNRRARL